MPPYTSWAWRFRYFGVDKSDTRFGHWETAEDNWCIKSSYHYHRIQKHRVLNQARIFSQDAPFHLLRSYRPHSMRDNMIQSCIVAGSQTAQSTTAQAFINIWFRNTSIIRLVTWDISKGHCDQRWRFPYDRRPPCIYSAHLEYSCVTFSGLHQCYVLEWEIWHTFVVETMIDVMEKFSKEHISIKATRSSSAHYLWPVT